MNSYNGKKAFRSFLYLVSLSLILFISLAGTIHYGLLNLVGLTHLAKDALLCCKTPFSFCLLSPTMFKTILPWAGLSILMGGLSAAIYKSGRSLIKSGKFLKTLHTLDQDEIPLLKDLSHDSEVEIIPFTNSYLKSVFTTGLIAPKIYISTALLDELTEEELRCVLLHEIHHAERRDPLRLFVLHFIRNTLFFLPLIHYLGNIFYKTKELAADERAVAATGRAFDMATALLKMVKIGAVKRLYTELVPAGVHVIDRKDLLEERIKNLLEPDSRKTDRISRGPVVYTSLGIFVFLFIFTLPIYSKVHRLEKCNADYCLSGERVCPSSLDDCHRMCEERKIKGSNQVERQ